VIDAGATPEDLARFDFWFDAVRRAVAGMVDHNHYLDSPINALLHRALMACGRRLAATGAVDDPADVWWLRTHQTAAAVRSLESPDRPDWRQLVAAHRALHAWQRSLRPPEYVGAPPPEQPAPEPRRPSGSGADEAPPASLVVRGQPAAPGIATGRVRLVDYQVLVPDVQPGDVFVARDCGVLWSSLLPAVAAVVLDGSNRHEHAMRVCREFGIPGVVQAKTATRALREGQIVTVDGDRGWVLAAAGEA
jgi:pyruvate,water dikinase